MSKGSLPHLLDDTDGQQLLREWMAIKQAAVYEIYTEARWELPIRSPIADDFTKWKVALGVVNSFAKYASSRTLAEIDSVAALEARGSLQLIADPELRTLVKGQAAMACTMYRSSETAPRSGDNPILPFSDMCSILIEWICPAAKFAAAPTKRAKILGSAPYWKPEKADSPITPVQLKGEFKDEH